MRTLQEKYNGINEGAFSKEQFLRDARLQLPNLITQYNGYDDAVQILKNRGMLQEAMRDSQNSYKGLKYEVWYQAPKGYFVKGIGELDKVIGHGFFDTESQAREHAEMEIDGYLGDDEISEEQSTKTGLTQNVKDGTKLKNINSGAFYTVDGKDNADGIYVRTEKGLRKNIPAKYFDAYEIVNEVNEARLTNKSLTDYRYKPTNDLDKYPYEQILRGLRVELEGMQVTGTPSAEDYKKALAKVLKNLQKDEIFYTNQIAGTNKKVDNHDQMVPIQGKEKEIKNSVDTFNGLKKAQLKEGFKSLIKKVLTENADPLRDYAASKEKETNIQEGPAVNNPKIEKLVNGINELISQAVEDGEPVGVIWPGGTWDEPYVYQPIQYKNGQLRITSKSVYGGEPETEIVRSREMEMDGLPMLRTLMRMYKKVVKKLGSNVNEGNEPVEKTVDLNKLHKIAMKAGNFGSDVKDALLNLYMGYEDKVPVSVIKKVLANYDLTFADLKGQPATFRPSSEFAHLFNTNMLKELGEDPTGASDATGEYEIMMHMLDADISNRSEAAKFFSMNYSDMPEQQIEFLSNHYFDNFREEGDSQVDEEYSRVLDLPAGDYFAIDGDWEDEFKGHKGLFFTIESGSIYDKNGEEFQVSPREFLSQFKPDEILKVEEEMETSKYGTEL